MAYLTTDTVQASLGFVELRVTTDGERSGAPNYERVQDAIDAAEAEVNAALRAAKAAGHQVPEVPLPAPVDPLITATALAITRYRLYRNVPMPEDVERGYTIATARLNAIASGKLVLAVTASETPAAAITGYRQQSAPYTDDDLDDFAP